MDISNLPDIASVHTEVEFENWRRETSSRMEEGTDLYLFLKPVLESWAPDHDNTHMPKQQADIWWEKLMIAAQRL